MLKKIFTLTLFLFLSACGYEAIHSKKNSINYDFAISKLTFIGNRDVNLKIKEKLNNYTLAKKNKSFQLRVSSTNEKLVLAKDISGDPTSFKSTIIITVQVFIEGNLRNDLQITEDFNYNNNSNKFNLKRYEKEIINNLAETAADKLIFKLSNIQ
tara:strand:- start:386 stop:850 length:465 start_codon:yes stop_codon:yes gene_type:complete